MKMAMNDDGKVDIPEGMDLDDARIAIKLLYGADQTYRSALHDFATFDKPRKQPQTSENGVHCRTISRCKRLRPNESERKKTTERSGRITKLHVTGIASIFLPSWDLSFKDVAKLDHLVCLKLNGCDSVPSDVFFELPCLKTLSLINCQEIQDAKSCIINHKRKNSNNDFHSTIQELDIRGGGLWGKNFLKALILLFPYLSCTLTSLRLNHTPYASCYTHCNNHMTAHKSLKTIEEILLRQRLFHKSMGGLLLEAISSLAKGMHEHGIPDTGAEHSTIISPLSYLSLSFFNSLLDKDVATLLLTVLPKFPHLETLELPHHTMSNLTIASERISQQHHAFSLQPHEIFSSSLLVRSSCVSSRSTASVSKLRRLWLKPSTMKEEREVLISLLEYFPALSCVSRSGTYKGHHLSSLCPCCCFQDQEGNPEKNQYIEYLLQMNHSGRCLIEGLEELASSPKSHQNQPCTLPLWPVVLERAWKKAPANFCARHDTTATNASASSCSVIYRLLREGTILFSRDPS